MRDNLVRHIGAALLAVGLLLGFAPSPAAAAPPYRADTLIQTVQYYGPDYYGPRRFYGRPRYYGPRYYGPRYYGPRFYGPPRGYYGRRYYDRRYYP